MGNAPLLAFPVAKSVELVGDDHAWQTNHRRLYGLLGKWCFLRRDEIPVCVIDGVKCLYSCVARASRHAV